MYSSEKIKFYIDKKKHIVNNKLTCDDTIGFFDNSNMEPSEALKFFICKKKLFSIRHLVSEVK